jgi:sugar-specific transcriptional regulator TrmB
VNLILIPLNRFEVTYEIVKSEPYGEVHKLLLESISARPATLEHLQDLFQLPPRMLIEVLVNLFYDGWVTVTSEGFRLTQKGRTSLKENAKPSNYLTVADKTYLMMERISGGLIHRDDIAFDSKSGLRRRHLWDYATRMPIEYHDNRVDAAQAKPLIRERAGGWIRYIQAPVMTSAGEWHWLPVDVDPTKGEVFGLPGRWKTLLQDRLLSFAMGLKPDLVERRYWDHSTRQRAERKTGQVEGWSVDLSAENLISDSRQHNEHLHAALESAKTSVLIISSVLGKVSSELRRWIDEARNRGVMVDLFWGHKSGSDDFPPGYFLNEQPSNCLANLLLYDTDQGHTSLVGSYPWLDTPDVTTVNATVILSQPGIVADICDSAATIIEADDTEVTLSDVPLRWKDTARKLEAKARTEEPSEGNSTVRIVRDQDHEACLQEYLATAQHRCAILSRQSNDAVRRLKVFSRRAVPTQLEVRICIQPNMSADESPFVAALRPIGAVLREIPELNAHAVMADTSVLVSGYEFLAVNSSRGSRPYNVGVAIDGGPLADEVWKMTME